LNYNQQDEDNEVWQNGYETRRYEEQEERERLEGQMSGISDTEVKNSANYKLRVAAERARLRALLLPGVAECFDVGTEVKTASGELGNLVCFDPASGNYCVIIGVKGGRRTSDWDRPIFEVPIEPPWSPKDGEVCACWERDFELASFQPHNQELWTFCAPIPDTITKDQLMWTGADWRKNGVVYEVGK
jgi:hypothetical protein